MSYIEYPQLQTIPMTLLRKFVSDIKQETLDQLKENPKVFQVCVYLETYNVIHMLFDPELPIEDQATYLETR